MISKINLEHVLFLDIETVPEFEDFSALTAEKKALWKQKSKYQRKDEYTAEEFYPRAGIWAEFGKIICISVGYFASDSPSRAFRITSFYGEEKEILSKFN